MDCHFLLQGIFWTQGLNIHLLHLRHCRQILYHWATWETKSNYTPTDKRKKKKLIFFFNDISFGISWWLLNWQVSTWQESRRCGFWSQLGVFQQCGLEKVLRPLRAWLLMDKKGTTFQDSDGYGCSHLSQNCCDYYYFYLQKLDSLKSHAAAAAKSLQLCQTLCDPTDSNPPASPVPGILQARTLEWVQHMQSLIFQKVLYSYYCSKCNIW